MQTRGLSSPSSGDITVSLHAESLARPLARPSVRSEGAHVGPSIPIHEADEDDEYPPRWPDDDAPPRRRRAGGWIVALVMMAAVGFLGFVAERRYRFVEVVAGKVPRPATVDPRVETFVAEGEHALGHGDLDAAQGAFDKASVLTEKDPRVLIGAARVAAAKADVPWLKVRLLAPDAAEDLRTTTSLLGDDVAVARRAADEALALAPQDPRAIRAKLDTLRLGGDVDAARGYVLAIFAQALEPETAYVLAALDLAQPAQPLPAAIDRLRIAAAAEARPGRAQAALVYALAKSGDTPGAKSELAKLDAATRPYPLLPNLHAFVSSDKTTPTPTPTSTPTPTPTSTPTPTPTPTLTLTPTPPSETSAIQLAMDAMRRGDFDHAERVYQGVLAGNPNDSQALAGLGDVLRMRHDPQGAIDAYKRALSVNPSYVPAVLGLGDTQWAQGDHAAAARTYKSIVDHFPDGSYPAYVNQRAAGGGTVTP